MKKSIAQKSSACFQGRWTQTLVRSVVVAGLALILPHHAAAQVNELTNPGFESGTTGWTTTGNQTYNNHPVITQGATYYNGGECGSDPTAETVNIHGGTHVGNVFGPYFSNPSTATWYQKGIPAAPSSTWNSSGWAYASHEDLSGPNQFYFEADFYNASGTLIAAYQSYIISNLTCGETTPFPLDTWEFLSVTNAIQVVGGVTTGVVLSNTGPAGIITAPPGTSSAGFQAVFVNINYAGGSMYLDDCSLNFLSGPAPPALSAISPGGITLCTNTTLTTTVTASSGNSISAIHIATTTSLLGLTTTTVSNYNYTSNSAIVSGLGTGTASVSFPLASNLVYKSVIVTANDSTGLSNSATARTFDTLAPSLVIESSDFNYTNGLFTDTPRNGGLALYTNKIGVQGVDENKASGSGTQANKGYYRPADAVIIGDAAPSTMVEQKFVTAAANGDTTNVEVEVGYNSVGDWLDYSRTYGPNGSAPAGTYNVWLYMTTDGGGVQTALSQVTTDPTQPNQTTNFLGNFGTSSFSESDSSWSAYQYVPLVDSFGNLVSVTLNAGVQTLRSTVVNNPNIGFYMLMPATPILTPALENIYPDGNHPFESATNFTVTIGQANGGPIAGSGIDVVLNGVDITSSPNLRLTQSSGSWTINYPVLPNAIYAAVINVTNEAGKSSTFVDNFDTFSINNYQWESVDYDFSTNNGAVWIGGLFIDNPVPSCDGPQSGEEAANSYFGFPTGFNPGVDPEGLGAIAQQGVDINFGNSGQTAPGNEVYRNDGVGSQTATDYLRPKFAAARQQFSDPTIGPINIGYYATGYWLNYTRHWLTNNYYVWGRLAGGAGPFSGTTLTMVTNGYGTSTQLTTTLGTFSDPNASGWQAWHWVPLLDTTGNMAVVSLGGQQTLRVTSGNNVNSEFFMLVQAPFQFKVNASVVSGQLTLSIPTSVGYNYVIKYKSNLSQPLWMTVGPTIPGDGTTHMVNESLSGTQGFYQIQAQQSN